MARQTDEIRVRVEDVAKYFTMHLQGGIVLPVLEGASFQVAAGTCTVLAGPSGSGKSSLLKMIYGNYRTDRGRILIETGSGTVDVASASPRAVLSLRRRVMGYVSQFLSVIPRVAAIDLVAAAAVDSDTGNDAQHAAGELLGRLNIPERLWGLPPATFSGGEQQRVNIARGFAGRHSVLLLDEPTASLDAANRAVVVEMIREKKSEGTALIGVFHDNDVREQVGDVFIDVAAFVPAEVA